MSQVSAISLYIHFPFCTRKCRYCDFYSERYDSGRAERFIGALSREWDIFAQEHGMHDVVVCTIYCGGGTPSLLTPLLWQRFCDTLIARLRCAADIEWTVECNPESFTSEKARLWLDCGVTRLSIGVQSLDNKTLGFLGRCHSARDGRAVLANPLLASFRSVGVDLIYGIPGQNPEILARALEEIFSYAPIAHLSAYELTIAEHTPLGRHKKILPAVPESCSADMLELIQSHAESRGLVRYEVSNWAKPGHECRHNCAYWRGAPYCGLGPSAHSYVPPRRTANSAHIDTYIKKITQGKLPVDHDEILSPQQQMTEMIMLALRTAQGLDETRFQCVTGESFCSPARHAAMQSLIAEGFLVYEKPYWRPTLRGLMRADAMAALLA